MSYFCVELINFPSILFGIETLFYNWNLKKDVDPFSSKFSQGIEGVLINGLIWMGPVDEMLSNLETKVNEGYKILKLKIGAIDFKKEVEILKTIRKKFGQNIQIRVDANGAFVEHQIRDVLLQLKEQGVHSIEQPIKTGNWSLMRELCRECTVPIALDEELIGVKSYEEKKNVLESLRPQYIILKPSIHGGIYGCNEWIELAESLKIGWWLTSALESNIGLEMIARFAAFLKPQVAQGLGTGGLFHNNFPSRLLLREGYLFLRDEKK